MTPKDKAKWLITKMGNELYESNGHGGGAMECALIAVDEMLELGSIIGNDLSNRFYIYWKEVKEEINKL